MTVRARLLLLAAGCAAPPLALCAASGVGTAPIALAALASAGIAAYITRGVVRELARIDETAGARRGEFDRLTSDFVASVSHELRTPLTTIKTLSRLLLRGGLEEAKRREYLETIAGECDRQIDLVLNLLDLTRLDAGAIELAAERVDVAELVRSSQSSQARAAELRDHVLEIEIEPSLPEVRGDRKALRRVLGNLVENAIKYTPDGGRIRIGARVVDGRVALSVADNGRGIHPKDLPMLFDRFHVGRDTTAAASDDEADEVAGIGLGLYLAKSVVEQMGGVIAVESEVGRGSTFTVFLPVWSSHVLTGGREEESDGEAVTGRR